MIRILFERFLPLTLYFTTLVSIMIIGTFIPHSSDLFYLWYFGFYWIFYHAIIYVTSFFIGLITQKRNKRTKPYYFLLSSLIFFIINTFALFLPLLSICFHSACLCKCKSENMVCIFWRFVFVYILNHIFIRHFSRKLLVKSFRNVSNSVSMH